jgi:cell division protein FtsB
MSSPRSSGQGPVKKKGAGRSMTLVLVLFLLSWTLAPPTQRYFAQRAQINAVKAQVAANNEALTEAAKQLQLWKDPQYIKTQARERLHFVLPGERQYIVTDSAEAQTAPTTAVAKDIPSGLPWYNRLIASITEVGAK